MDMRAYSDAYLEDVVENQGKLFDFVAQSFPDKDTGDFIKTYMSSKTRKSIDEAKAYVNTMDARELWDYFTETEQYQMKPGKSISGFMPDWIGEFYAYYHIERLPQLFIYIATDLFGEDTFEMEKLCRFILTVRKNYRSVTYHNWEHGFHVAHALWLMIKANDDIFTKFEKMALIIGGICHDLDHRGYNILTNNWNISFKTKHRLYNIFTNIWNL